MPINLTPIDTNFPVAGRDNPSQGFRSNFTNIVNNFNLIKTEVDELLLTAPNLTTNNDFGGNNIINANLVSTTTEARTTYAGGTNDLLTAEVSWESGAVHVIQVSILEDAPTLFVNFTNWPEETNRFAKMTVILFKSNEVGTRTVTWQNNGETTGIKIEANTEVPTLTDFGLTQKIYEIFTYDAGETLYIKHLGDYS